MKRKLLWAPQAGPQQALVHCPFQEVFFGGARGGGKTDGVLGRWAIKEKRYGKHFNAIMFRRTTVSSEDAIERSKEIYQPLGAKFNETKTFWRMPNGGRVSFRYLESVKDAEEWQGRNVTDGWVEEAGHYVVSDPIDRLFGVLRSAHGVPTQLILTANPGGAGQHWLRERYHLAPFPKRPQVHSRLLPNGATHRYAVIPSRITDNKILMQSDPQYINRLYMVGSAELVKGWLEGDWMAIQGAFFDCWHEKRHVHEPFSVPDHWLRFRSMDWGSASPSSIGWWAVVSDQFQTPEGMILPRGFLLRYREWYTSKTGDYARGLKLTAEQIADGIKEREAGENLTYGVLDPAAFAEDGGPSHAQRMADRGVFFKPADNKRISTGTGVKSRGAMGGWDMMRQRLVGNEEKQPMIGCFKTCTASINTIPTLQHDEKRPEDLDTNSIDHAADDWRYACMSRPWVRPMPGTTPNNLEDYGSTDDSENADEWRVI